MSKHQRGDTSAAKKHPAESDTHKKKKQAAGKSRSPSDLRAPSAEVEYKHLKKKRKHRLSIVTPVEAPELAEMLAGAAADPVSVLLPLARPNSAPDWDRAGTSENSATRRTAASRRKPPAASTDPMTETPDPPRQARGALPAVVPRADPAAATDPVEAHRRRAGEGTIVQLDDGRYQCQVSLGYKNGKRFRPTGYTDTREAAEAWIAAIRQAHQQDQAVDKWNQTVGEFLCDWLDYSADENKPTTYMMHETIVRLHLVPIVGRIRLRHLTKKQVEELRDYHKARLSPQRTNRILVTLGSALTYAENEGYIARNVARGVRPLRLGPIRRPPPLDRKLAQRVCQQLRASSSYLALACLLSLLLGLRIGEVLGLRWQDVNLADGRLLVEVQLQRVRRRGQPTREWLLTTPKTNSGGREIPLPASLVTLLQSHQVGQQIVQQKAGAGWDTTWDAAGLIFRTRYGRPVSIGTLHDQWRRILRFLDRPPVRYHVLRKTFQVLLEELGVKRTVRSALMGHENGNITEDIYGHVFWQRRYRAIARLSATLMGDDPPPEARTATAPAPERSRRR